MRKYKWDIGKGVDEKLGMHCLGHDGLAISEQIADNLHAL